MIKVMLIYPPGEAYQRGEDRCQVNIKASVSNALRACNDLGYIAAALKDGYEVFLKDYPALGCGLENLISDVREFLPDVVFISTTNGSIYDDLKTIGKIKEIKHDTLIILKGAIFFNPDEKLFEEANFDEVDYMVGSESEFTVPELIRCHFNAPAEIKNLQGVCYKENGNLIINKVYSFNDTLDELAFPDRSKMPNELYLNPCTNRPMATITTSKGCPSSCIYCLSPVISGKKVRYRSCRSILNEISECYEKYDIKDFFFKSDTFTINKSHVTELCDLIINSPLNGKINWVANSRVNTLDEEMIVKMKAAGCSLIALGLESGSDESLKLMKKGTTVEQNKTAVKLIKTHGIKIFGFYLIGFPWENEKHLKETEKFIFEADTDFIELSVATPFKGSELYNMLLSDDKVSNDVLGKDSFKYLNSGTDFLTKDQLEKFRKRVILKYHLRPSFILKKIFDKNLTFGIFFNYIKYGLRLIQNVLTEKNNG